MSKEHKRALMALLAAGLGGVVGALATRWLERAGLKRTLAAIGVTAVGGITAALTKGPVRAAAVGMAASGAGQLASTWFAALEARIGADKTSPGKAASASGSRPATRLEDVVDRAVRRRSLDEVHSSSPTRDVTSSAPEPTRSTTEERPPVDAARAAACIRVRLAGLPEGSRSVSGVPC
jgi:hypothetical protein